MPLDCLFITFHLCCTAEDLCLGSLLLQNVSFFQIGKDPIMKGPENCRWRPCIRSFQGLSCIDCRARPSLLPRANLHERPLEFLLLGYQGMCLAVGNSKFQHHTEIPHLPPMTCSELLVGFFGRLSSRHREPLPHPERYMKNLKSYVKHGTSTGIFLRLTIG